MNRPQSALTLSHRMIWEHIYNTRIPCATVFEDDASLAANFSQRFRESCSNLPPFDEVQLGYCPGGGKVKTAPKDTTSTPIVKYGWPGSCCHAYVVSMQGAYFFASVATNIGIPADGQWSPIHQKGKKAPGTKGWRSALDQAPGTLPGSYWYLSPMLAYQGADDIEEGHA
jgi:hypothetical protein